MLKVPYYFISFSFSVILRPFTMTLFCYHNSNTNDISLLIIFFRNNGCLATIFNIATGNFVIYSSAIT